jgi:hypothetical protein
MQRPKIQMRGRGIVLVALTAVLAVSCATASPPSRLAQYIADPAGDAAASPLPQGQIRAALVLVPDTSAPGAAPPPPEGALDRLAEQLQQTISRGLSIHIERIVPASALQPGRGPEAIQEIGRRENVDYVLLVVASSTEQEYPMTLFLGWTTHAQPGWRRDNWSLLEVALVEVQSGRTLVRAEGRGFATLDRPSAPGINQWYPVIWLRPQDPARRIWPPTYEGAPNTLRVVAFNEAAKRLVLNLQDAWIDKRAVELGLARS